MATVHSVLTGGIMEKHKKCSRCFFEKPLTEFYYSKGYPYSLCKRCTSLRNATNQKKKKKTALTCEERLAYQREYYRTHKEQYLEYYRRSAEKERSKIYNY